MQRDLTRGNVAYSLIVFSLPMILGNILQQCYNIADTLIVSYALGPDALAAVGSSFTLMTFITSIILGLSIGSGTLFSIRFGQRDEDGLKDSLAAAFFLIAILTIIITSLSYLTINLLESFLSVPKTIWPLMKSYLIFIYLGIPAIFLYNFFSSFLRALGESKTPLIFFSYFYYFEHSFRYYICFATKAWSNWSSNCNYNFTVFSRAWYYALFL